MITLFRKIRQQLLTQNKLTRYLVYAVGEIFLVVIGILIALQINNWNEEKKEQAILQASLSSLKLNLQEDIENLTNQIEYNKAVFDAVDFSFRLISLPQYDDLPLSMFADSTFDLASERTFLPTKTAFNSMESGSHFQWIKDQELIQAIFNYYDEVDIISNVTFQNNQFVKNHVEDFTYNNMELGSLLPNANPYPKKRNPKLNNTKILRESAVFENALIGRKFRSGGEIDLSQEAIKDATNLIHSIDRYVQNSN